MLLGTFHIVGHSMLPTFSPGQTVLVSSIPYLFSNPAIGDIVVYRHTTGDNYIKRVGKKERDRYFLIGDNPVDSHDSRDFGWVERKDIVGKVIKKL